MEVHRLESQRRTVKPRVSSGRRSSRGIVQLSTCDLAIPNVYAMAIYAFKSPGRQDVVGELERGLEQVLDEYPEWAGRLFKDLSTNTVAVELNDDGVALMEASMDCCLQDLMPFNPSPLLFQLVPATQSAQELLLIQVTSFRCGGIVLGVCWHHRLADGQAFFSFMDNWARLTRGAPLACKPFRDRTALTARETSQPLTDEYMLLAPTVPGVQATTTTGTPLGARKLHFSFDFLQRIKARACETEGGADDSKAGGAATMTTFESLTAHLWTCITKARGLSGDVKTQIMIPMNGRSRLHPPLPESYFGNATFMPSSGTEVQELVSRSVCYAARLVHSAIAKADNDYLRSAIDLMEVKNRMAESVEVAVPPSMCPNIVVTSWVRFPLYDVDFGWGEPVYVGNVLDLFEGIIILLPSYTRDGSIDAVVALFQPEIETLEQLCYIDT